jgi:hypothetical protein
VSEPYQLTFNRAAERDHSKVLPWVPIPCAAAAADTRCNAAWVSFAYLFDPERDNRNSSAGAMCVNVQRVPGTCSIVSVAPGMRSAR